MPTQKEIRAISNHIRDTVEYFSEDLSALEKQTYNKIFALLKDLTLDAKGNVIQNITNLSIVNKVKGKLNEMITNPVYKKKVADLQSDFNTMTELQQNYFSSTFVDFTPPKFIEQVTKTAFEETRESLVASGIKENVINEAVTIVSDNVKSGASLFDLSNELKDFLVSGTAKDGKLVSYTKQIIGDAISQHAANYNKIITDDLGLEWYQYVGPIIKTTRPICRALVDKEFIHESELGGVARGIVNGQKVSVAGMIPGTTKGNFQIYRGGYNCGHLLIPVSSEVVPKSLRKKFEKKKDANTN